MKVTKITLWDGSIFYTDSQDEDFYREFFVSARKRYDDEDRVMTVMARLDVIEMPKEEYIEKCKQFNPLISEVKN